ncbi:MAG: acetolactate decarboxylase [Desulfobacteraceae bacterium]|nr:acetolactate decarboxylase [Desulfobacteraceae bacterium]MCB9495072.1 acetolactate decarboxylase [Desulfobacteraceae bacterium]
MKLHSKIVLICFLVFFTGCSQKSLKSRLYQVSTIDALIAGVYDGEINLGGLKKHGDFGIGTFDGLDGEMIFLDGIFYKVKSDGKVYGVSNEEKTPFASICNFNPEISFNLEKEFDFNSLKEILDAKILNKNLFYAVKMTGNFSYVKTRSVPMQKRPYPKLIEVTKNQPEFYRDSVKGTIVGFYCPKFVKGVNVPGYHLHFLSEDKNFGGHILEFKAETSVVEIDEINEFLMVLLEKSEDFASKDFSEDKSRELEKIEK